MCYRGMLASQPIGKGFPYGIAPSTVEKWLRPATQEFSIRYEYLFIPENAVQGNTTFDFLAERYG